MSSTKGALVSVIVSFFNAQAFLAEAVDSVFRQTFEDWELLLVDDGSTDASSEIAKQYQNDCPQKVFYIRHPKNKNLGLPVSRNVGITFAKGEYIAVLDSDDVWLPSKLEQQVRILATHPEAGMVFGCSQYWRSWTGDPEDICADTPFLVPLPIESVQAPPTLLRMTLAGAQLPPPSDILFRAAAAIGVGGFEEEFVGMYATYEDQAFMAKMYLTVPIFVSRMCWDRYRIHPDSLCAVQAKENRESVVQLFYLRWLHNYLRKHGITDPVVKRLAGKALRKAILETEHPAIYKLARRGLDSVRQSRFINGPYAHRSH